MSLETENEQLRTRLAEMAAEVERLHSVIDEANAQEPFGYSCGDWLFKEKGQFDRYSAAYIVGNKPEEKTAVAVYARPIPAQQSPAVAVTDEEKAYNDWTWNLVDSSEVFNCPSLAAKTAWMARAKLSCKSPRITEQDAREILKARDENPLTIIEKWLPSILDKLNGDKNAR